MAKDSKNINDPRGLEPWVEKIKLKSETHIAQQTEKELSPNELNAIWAGLASQLPQQTATHKKFPAWVRSITAIAASLIILTTGGYLYFRYQEKGATLPPTKHILAEANKEAIHRQTNTGNKQHMPTIPTLDSPEKSEMPIASLSHTSVAPDRQTIKPASSRRSTAAHLPSKKDALLPALSVQSESTQSAQDDLTSSCREEPALHEDSTQVPAPGEKQKERKYHKEVTVRPYDYRNESLDYIASLDEEDTAMNFSRLSFTASSSATSTFGKDRGTDITPMTRKKLMILPHGNSKEISFFQYDKASFTHFHPLHFNISVAYALSNEFYIESGLRYSLLNSEVKGYTLDPVEQNVHYMGVPLSASFILYEKSRFNIYIGFGIEVSKVVASYLDNKPLGVKPWQFSATAHVGASLRLSPMVQLYVAPEVRYYLDDRTRLQTYYKEHPLNFTISFGIRFTP